MTIDAKQTGGLTKEQVDNLYTTGDKDSQTGLPEPEHTIQVIRSMTDSEHPQLIDFENRTIELSLDNEKFIQIAFNSIDDMYLFHCWLEGQMPIR